MCFSLARTARRGSFSTCVRISRTNIQTCRSTVGHFRGTEDCRTPGSYPKDVKTNSLRQDRSSPTTKCWHTKASSFLATALYSIMQTLFPKGSTFNVNSVTSALQQAWKYLQHMDPRDEEQVMVQQDLIGFCNSVPHSRNCSALQLMLYRLQEHFCQTADELAFQVDHKGGTKDLRIFKGQGRFRGSNTKVLQIRHVMELTEVLLQSAYLKVGLDTYCQTQGACVGSPLAPVLSAMVAAE